MTFLIILLYILGATNLLFLINIISIVSKNKLDLQCIESIIKKIRDSL